MKRTTSKAQTDKYSSPWSLGERVKMALWGLTWLFFFRPTPKPLSGWRVWLLKAFGAKIQGKPYVAASAKIKKPWNLRLGHRACLGDHCVVYNLDLVDLEEGATVAQEAYLCCGSHDFSDPELSLVTGPLLIGRDAFVGARAFLLPGVVIGTRAIVGACSLVSKDVAPDTIVAGNPAKKIGVRA